MVQSGVPLYKQVKDKIKASVQEGLYPEGARIPTEDELCKMFGVSRITVRRAVSDLVAEGTLKKVRGIGTFASGFIAPAGNIRPVSSFHEACESLGKKASSDIIFQGTGTATERDCSELRIAPGKIIVIRRIRMADRQPVILESNRFSMAYSYLADQDLTGSLYNILKGYGVEIIGATHEITLVTAEPEQARLLGIRTGSPLIHLHEVVYDQKNRPIHISDQYLTENFTMIL